MLYDGNIPCILRCYYCKVGKIYWQKGNIMSGIGRPTKFTKETIDKLLVAIRKGAPYKMACNYAGISYEIFRQWIIKAKAGKDKDYVAFFATLKEAEGHTALIWLDKIDKAMNEGVWQAAAWKLERRYFHWFSSRAADIEFDKRLTKLERKNSKNIYGDATDGKANNETTQENS